MLPITCIIKFSSLFWRARVSNDKSAELCPKLKWRGGRPIPLRDLYRAEDIPMILAFHILT